MMFPVCSPHHLSSNGVLIRTTSQPKTSINSSARIGVTIQVGEIYTCLYTNLYWGSHTSNYTLMLGSLKEILGRHS